MVDKKVLKNVLGKPKKDKSSKNSLGSGYQVKFRKNIETGEAEVWSPFSKRWVTRLKGERRK